MQNSFSDTQATPPAAASELVCQNPDSFSFPWATHLSKMTLHLSPLSHRMPKQPPHTLPLIPALHSPKIRTFMRHPPSPHTCCRLGSECLIQTDVDSFSNLHHLIFLWGQDQLLHIQQVRSSLWGSRLVPFLPPSHLSLRFVIPKPLFNHVG